MFSLYSTPQCANMRTCCVTLLFIITIQYVHCASRLSVKGSKIYFPNGSEAILRGFNMVWDQEMAITALDPAEAKSYLSGINVARLVMIHWDDGDRHEPGSKVLYPDCKTNNASNGYLSDYCLNAMDEHIKWMQSSDIWSIITMRGQIAAGGNYPNESDIFHNDTLKNEFISMWKFLANRYKDTDQIAGFEIMSEPRTDISLVYVKNMYQETCTEIQNIDPTQVCIIGAAKFYSLCNLNATMLIPNNNVIYNFNFFIPKAYTKVGLVNYTINWPGNMRCCDLQKPCLPGWCTKHDCNQMVNINKEWMNASVSIPIINFRDKYNKTVFIDQWGVYYNSPNRTGYDDDMLSIMNHYGLSWTNWEWRGWEVDTHGMQHNLSNGSYFTDMLQIKEFQKFIN